MIDRFEQFSSTIAGIHKTIQKIKRDEMIRFGLKGPHVQCMVALARHEHGLTLARLCEICEMDKAAISRSLSELEEAGMVERAGDKSYRAVLRLSEAGLQTARSINETVGAAVEFAGRGLSDDDRRIFYQALDLISENLRQISKNGIIKREESERKD